MKRLLILSGSYATTEDERLSSLATQMGISTKILPLEDPSIPLDRLFDQTTYDLCSLALHVGTLSQLCSRSKSNAIPEWIRNGFFQEILVYGSSETHDSRDVLVNLTDSAVRGIHLEPLTAVRYSLPQQTRDLSAQLAGQSLLMNAEYSVPWFEVSEGCTPIETIMTVNEHPMFVRSRTVACDLFLLAGRMPDINKWLSRSTELKKEYVQLIPPMIFLRKAFGVSCWHGCDPTARLIIDDPLLSKTYGALDFEALKASMQRLGYGTSIAFIPWNYWRTSRRSAARLLNVESEFGICVHGCDHTNREFASGTVADLVKKAMLGLQRMEDHRKRIGIAFDDVMVFPQGVFSKAAISALRSANYLAAINSTCFPRDSEQDDITVTDLLWPAVTRFNGFPIFQRRLPTSPFDSAMDLFLGKPAFLVEHHEYFSNGYAAFEEFVAALHRIEPHLSWPSLTAQLARCSLRKYSSNRFTEMRFFTRRFQLVAQEEEPREYRLSKSEQDSSAVQHVLVDGKNVPFGFEDGFLIFEAEAEPGKPRMIEIVDRRPTLPPVRSFGLAYNTRVFVRRGLAELRDNTLSRHHGTLQIAQKIAKVMKLTWDS